MTRASALSPKTITAAQPTDKLYTISDPYGTGLALYVYPNGRKLWKVRKPIIKNGRRTTAMGDLGAFPAVSLKDARKAAAAWQPEIIDKKKTVAALFEEWRKNEVTVYKRPNTQRGIDSLTNKYILPFMGDEIAEKVTGLEVTALCESIEKTGYITSAARVRTILAMLFKYGKSHGFNTHNNARTVELHTHKTKPQAALTATEDITAFLRDLANGRQSTTCLALLFIIYTGLRVNEAVSAEWWQIDFDNAAMTIPEEKMKMKQEHKIPLSHQALQILQQLKGYGFKQVFFGNGHNGTLSAGSLLDLIIRLGYTGESKPKTTVHGFRATLSTVLNEHGFISDIIEKQLAHAGKGVRAVYNRAEYWEQRKATAQWYADYLDSLRDGTATPELPKGCTIGG